MQFVRNNKVWLAVLLAVILAFSTAFYFVWQQGEARFLVGEKAPNFALRGFDGGVVYMEELRGKPVVLNFWASWCIFCRKEMEALQSLQQEYKDRGLMVIGVHRSETESKELGLEFAREHGATYALVEDPNDNIFRYFSGVSNIVPLTVLIDREGIVVDRLIGPRREDQFREIIGRLVTGGQ